MISKIKDIYSRFNLKDKIVVKCERCGIKFKTLKSRINKGFGKFCSTNCSNKSSSIKKLGKNNVNWKGDDVGYGGLHSWIKRRIVKPSNCENCNKKSKLDLANISGKYKRDLTDWEWLCRSCHMNKDGRMIKLLKNNRKTKSTK